MDTVLLIGKPNVGKTLLFNKLTGLNQKVANFSGATVSLKKGKLKDTQIIDFPGSYSINPISIDEKIAINKFHQELESQNVSLLIIVLDATKLESSLVFALQAAQKAHSYNKKTLFVLNMIDEIQKSNIKIQVEQIEKELGIPIIQTSAKNGHGLDDLKKIIANPNFTHSINLFDINPEEKAREINQKYGGNIQPILELQNRLDGLFLSNFFGGISFFIIMLLIFQSIFTWASPLMELTEAGINFLASTITTSLPNGMLKDFIADALFGGFGSFLVFVPQIAILTFFIGLLEDSGYLARAALICHKPLSFFGLNGKSFIPLLSGHACAIPAIMASRSIESPRKRLITILTIPFTVCSARLPVYALFTIVLIPPTKICLLYTSPSPRDRG